MYSHWYLGYLPMCLPSDNAGSQPGIEKGAADIWKTKLLTPPIFSVIATKSRKRS